MYQLLPLFILLCCVPFAHAQNIGIGTTAPHPSAKLDIVDANRGLLVPRVALAGVTDGASPINAPAIGLLVYNTNAAVTGGSGAGFYYWSGIRWVMLATVADNDWAINANGTGLEALPGGNTSAGAYALTAGQNNSAAGTHAICFGSGNSAAGAYAVVAGGDAFNDASASHTFIGGGGGNQSDGGYSAIVGGLDNTSSGFGSAVLGGESNYSNNAYATTVGGVSNEAQGAYSVAAGRNSRALSYGEMVVGLYNTLYTPLNATAWNGLDRIFVVGNGQSNTNRSNALTLYKNGVLNINDSYDLPNVDGAAGQVLTTNGSGQVSWQPVGGGSAGWALAGNAGPNPTANFLGTTDNIGLYIRTNNINRLQITANGRVGINTLPNNSAQLHVDGNIMVNRGQRLILDGFNFDNWLYYDISAGELRLESPSETVHVLGDVARISTGTESIYLSGGLNGGSIGVNTLSPTAMFDINGNNGYDQLRLRQPFTPSSTVDTRGNVGDVSWDDNFMYIKTSVGWKRTALSTF